LYPVFLMHFSQVQSKPSLKEAVHRLQIAINMHNRTPVQKQSKEVWLHMTLTVTQKITVLRHLMAHSSSTRRLLFRFGATTGNTGFVPCF
jgi:hypothetical protein